MSFLPTAPLQKHTCYNKCATGCTGDDCFCDGYLAGHDGPESNAFCGDIDVPRSAKRGEWLWLFARRDGLRGKFFKFGLHALTRSV